MLCCGKNRSSEEPQTDAQPPPSGRYQLQPLSPMSPFQVPELPLSPRAHVVHTPPQGTGISPPPFPPIPAASRPIDVPVWGTQSPTRPVPVRGLGEARFHFVEESLTSLTESRVSPDKVIVAIDFGNLSIFCFDRIRNLLNKLFAGTTFSGVVNCSISNNRSPEIWLTVT